MERFKIIAKNTTVLGLDGCPVQADKHNILLDNTCGKNVIQIMLRNRNDKKIKSVYLSIECFDDAKDSIGILNDISYLNVNAAKGQTFGDRQAVNTEFDRISRVEIKVEKVVFCDETIWRNEKGETLSALPLPKKSAAFFGQLWKQYKRETEAVGLSTEFAYTENDRFWQCSCGQNNALEDDACFVCGARRSKLKAISDLEYLEKKNKEYLEEEERKRQAKQAEEERIRRQRAADAERLRIQKEAEEAEKARKAAEAEEKRKQLTKKIIKIGSVSAAAVVIVIALNVFLTYRTKLPKYSEAIMLMENGQYVEAVALFDEIGKFKDSYEFRAEAVINMYSKNTIAAGKHHIAGLKSNGTVVATGANSDGQCDVESWKDIVSITAGICHTIGLKSDGTVIAAGDNTKTQCNVESWNDIISVAAGDYHTIGLKNDGTVLAAGKNTKNDGQCDVSNWSNIIAVAAGHSHTVALRNDGTVVATGDNLHGQCDTGKWNSIIAVTAGNGHTVGLKSDGTVVATGYNKDGECNVGEWKNIIAIAAGSTHTVGLKNDGTIVATGVNNDGQCDVKDWTGIVAIAAGDSYTIGLKSDGTVVATGNNAYGQYDVEDWSDIMIYE